MAPLPQAHVQWWDSSSVYVRCPTCEGIHQHFFNKQYKIIERRLSHCYTLEDQCQYTIHFPFDEASGHAGYEIDKERAMFVSGGADPTECFGEVEDDRLGRSVDDYNGQKKWTEATETIRDPDGYNVDRLSLIVSEMVCGNVGVVRQYLEISKDANILLHGIEAYKISTVDDSASSSDGNTDASSQPEHHWRIQITGKTALHLAACESSSKMVELLLQKGADPNAVDMAGRAPLMEAALWGRLRTVDLLLAHGANKHHECFRDGQRLRAVNFAMPLEKNKQERHERAGRIYKEDTYNRDLDRKRIVRRLNEDLEQPERSQPVLSGFSFTRSPKSETILTLVHHFDIPNKWKTVAVLLRDSPFPEVAGMSGWAHGEDSSVQVGGRQWTKEVLQLCDTIGYALPSHERDQGEPGKYHACHAEKQLIAFFVNKHLFLPKEVGRFANMADLSLKDLAEEEYEQQEKSRELLSSLREVSPPVGVKKATLLVCRPICDDCRRFTEHVNCALGLELTLFHRCLDAGCRTCQR